MLVLHAYTALSDHYTHDSPDLPIFFQLLISPPAILPFHISIFSLFLPISCKMLGEEFTNLAEARNAIMIHTIKRGESY